MQMAESLFMYTEEREPPPEAIEMKRAIHGCPRAVFLGFGFHRQNVELLAGGGDIGGTIKDCYATVKGESDPSIATYESRVHKLLNFRGDFVPTECGTLLSTYRALIAY